LPALFLFPVSEQWKIVFLITVPLGLLTAFLLILVQKKGVLSSLFNLFKHFGWWEDFFNKTHVSVHEVDQRLRAFYKKKDARWLVTVILHFIGWVAGGVEVYFMFLCIGHPISIAESVLIEAFIQILRTISFFIPGNLGVQEAGLALCAGYMGFDPSIGVILSLLKRVRQVIWTAVGFVLLWFLQKDNPEHDYVDEADSEKQVTEVLET
jgi:uncharacterized protein (TIRG00374 family)